MILVIWQAEMMLPDVGMIHSIPRKKKPFKVFLSMKADTSERLLADILGEITNIISTTFWTLQLLAGCEPASRAFWRIFQGGHPWGKRTRHCVEPHRSVLAGYTLLPCSLAVMTSEWDHVDWFS